MRRASNRIPKRSLDTDFELSQAAPHPKGRAGARRGPTGPSKARKAAFTSTGAIIPQGVGYSRFCLTAADRNAPACYEAVKHARKASGNPGLELWALTGSVFTAQLQAFATCCSYDLGSWKV